MKRSHDMLLNRSAFCCLFLTALSLSLHESSLYWLWTFICFFIGVRSVTILHLWHMDSTQPSVHGSKIKLHLCAYFRCSIDEHCRVPGAASKRTDRRFILLPVCHQQHVTAQIGPFVIFYAAGWNSKFCCDSLAHCFWGWMAGLVFICLHFFIIMQWSMLYLLNDYPEFIE